MASNDRRFGFSVVGGVDEGVSPRVDDVQPGKCEVFHKLLFQPDITIRIFVP
jgi:hypothetical protein